MFFGCVYVFICFASYAVFRMCAYMFFHFIPCFLDAFVISCVLLAPLFSECVSSCFFHIVPVLFAMRLCFVLFL